MGPPRPLAAAGGALHRISSLLAQVVSAVLGAAGGPGVQASILAANIVLFSLGESLGPSDSRGRALAKWAGHGFARRAQTLDAAIVARRRGWPPACARRWGARELLPRAAQLCSDRRPNRFMPPPPQPLGACGVRSLRRRCARCSSWMPRAWPSCCAATCPCGSRCRGSAGVCGGGGGEGNGECIFCGLESKGKGVCGASGRHP